MARERKVERIMKYIRFMMFIVAVVVVAYSGLAQADQMADTGKKIMNSYKDAVVKVEVVVQSKFVMNGSEMGDREFKSEVTGTVVDPSGLVLVSLTTIDPSKFMDSLMRGMGSDMKMEMKLDLKGVKIILPNETELDAKIVLRDKDLDMAFIRPKQKPTKAMASINMNDRSNPQHLDEIVILGRLSKVANYAPSVMSARIAAVVTKPHTFYIPQVEGGDMGDIGTPAFTMDGKLVGLILMRILTKEGGGFGAMMGGAGAMGITPVIMPTAEILEASKQAVDEQTMKD
jgi:hypothetical protein